VISETGIKSESGRKRMYLKKNLFEKNLPDVERGVRGVGTCK